jgi:hypothetical protein
LLFLLSGEATNTNFIVFGMIRPGLEPMIYHTQGECANHYAIEAVVISFFEIPRTPLIGLVTIYIRMEIPTENFFGGLISTRQLISCLPALSVVLFA